jgi:protoheme IX farnesyltransferase
MTEFDRAPGPTAPPSSSPGEEPHPSTLSDYVSLTKPGITGLIVAVAVGGYFLSAPSPIRLAPLLILVLLGASASAGAATLNHYFDRDVDTLMRRTRLRPLPDRRIDPGSRALYGGLLLSAIGVGGAAVLLNPLTAFSILLGGVTYVGVYTLWLKRRSSWNIVIGGFAGSAPALAGSAAAVGHFTPAALALALVLLLWTPPHFWSLALLLRKDYQAAGLPMLPDMNDPAYSGRVIVFSAALLLPATALLWWLGGVPVWAGAALLLLGVLFVALTAPLLVNVEPSRARRGFIFSGVYLLSFLVILIVAGVLLHPGFVIGS